MLEVLQQNEGPFSMPTGVSTLPTVPVFILESPNFFPFFRLWPYKRIQSIYIIFTCLIIIRGICSAKV